MHIEYIKEINAKSIIAKYERDLESNIINSYSIRDVRYGKNR